jgi:predicted Zn-dependent protease
LGLLDLARGDDVAAEFELRAALGMAPREQPLLASLAQLLVRRGAGEEALVVAHSSAGFHAGDAAAWSLVASCHAAVGEHAEALDTAEAGLALAPEDGELQRVADAARRALDFER